MTSCSTRARFRPRASSKSAPSTATKLRALQAFYEKYLNPDRALTKLNVVNIAHLPTRRGIKQGYFYAAPTCGSRRSPAAFDR